MKNFTTIMLCTREDIKKYIWQIDVKFKNMKNLTVIFGIHI